MNQPADWHVTDTDRELFARELDSFVPPRVFDAHAHWYDTAHFRPEGITPFLQAGPKAAGGAAYAQAMEELLPGRGARGVFFGYPQTGLDVEAANAFVAAELGSRPESRGQLLVTPADDPEFIRQTVRAGRLVGLKCYHVFSPVQPTFESSLEAFLPESQVRVAHEEGLSITIHIVRARALADPVNQETLVRYARRYPNARLILAHAARGFNPHHTLAGVGALRGLDNIWFDTSVVTDAGALEAIIRTLGSGRVLYGSDYPVSHLRGRCVALGDSFFWISAANTQLQAGYGELQLSLVGLEALRTLKLAAYSLRLPDHEVEGIFAGNAERLWDL